MSESPDTKYEVPIKQVEKTLKISDRAKAELKSSGMMDDKGKLKLKGVSPKTKNVKENEVRIYRLSCVQTGTWLCRMLRL